MLLAKTSTITHELTGSKLQTPLLIPSFSSKGLMTSNGNCELKTIFDATSVLIDHTYLISAFDIHNKFLPPMHSLPCPEFIFIDSGGYEVLESRDSSSAIYRPSDGAEKWDEEMLKTVYDDIPEEKPVVLVSYDHHNCRYSFEEQINNAKTFFKDYPTQLKLILLKPETEKQKNLSYAVKMVANCANLLTDFDIIGITDKELGDSILDKMITIARLRKILDENNITAPIHIFGALDPLTVCLYFMAGAEIFDGLTWIRYGYGEGTCNYMRNHGAINLGIHLDSNTIELITWAENYNKKFIQVFKLFFIYLFVILLHWNCSYSIFVA